MISGISRYFNMHEKKIILSLYLVIGFTRIWQAFSSLMSDNHEFLLTAYQISIGKLPYADFFQHHLVLNSFFHSLIFKISNNPIFVLAVFTLLALLFSFFGAWVVYKIAVKYKLKNPHYAALFFLASFTGMHKFFLRADYFLMICVLLFFYFEQPFLKIFFLALAGGSHPLYLLPSCRYYSMVVFAQENPILFTLLLYLHV